MHIKNNEVRLTWPGYDKSYDCLVKLDQVRYLFNRDKIIDNGRKNQYIVGINDATVNHSGTLNVGHYWAFDTDGDRWLECNDRSVVKVKSTALNNSSCCILFYVQC